MEIQVDDTLGRVSMRPHYDIVQEKQITIPQPKVISRRYGRFIYDT